MDHDILEYIRNQRVCVIAVEMPDGSPHAATVHYAHTEDPLTFIFETDRTYRKSEALLGKAVRASVVIGTDEAEMKTLQMDGEAKLLDVTETGLIEVYLKKFDKKREKAENSSIIFFAFHPTWWRFTDWTHPKGKRILSSPDGVL